MFTFVYMHFLSSNSKAKVILGAHSIRDAEPEKQKIRVLNVFPHELFNARTFDYDIQLLQVRLLMVY